MHRIMLTGSEGQCSILLIQELTWIILHISSPYIESLRILFSCKVIQGALLSLVFLCLIRTLKLLNCFILYELSRTSIFRYYWKSDLLVFEHYCHSEGFVFAQLTT